MASTEVHGLLVSTDSIQIAGMRILQALTGKSVETINSTNMFNAWMGRLDSYIEKTREIYARHVGQASGEYEVILGFRYSEREDGSIDNEEEIYLYLIRNTGDLDKDAHILGSISYMPHHPYGVHYPSSLQDYQRPTVMANLLNGLLFSVIPKEQMLTFAPAPAKRPEKTINLDPVDPKHPLLQKGATTTYLDNPTVSLAIDDKAGSTSAASTAPLTIDYPHHYLDSSEDFHQSTHQNKESEMNQGRVSTVQTRRVGGERVPDFLSMNGAAKNPGAIFSFNPAKHHVITHSALKDILSARAAIVATVENKDAVEHFRDEHVTQYLIGYTTDVITDPTIVIAWNSHLANVITEEAPDVVTTVDTVNAFYVIRTPGVAKTDYTEPTTSVQ